MLNWIFIATIALLFLGLFYLDRKKLQLKTQYLNLQQTHNQLQQREMQLQHTLQETDQEIRALHRQLTILETEKNQFASLQQQMTIKFEKLAQELFESNRKALTQESTTSLTQLLTPLKEKLSEFHKKVDDCFHDAAKERFALKEEVAKMANAHEKMTFETHRLTKALKGDNKLQGNWGELLLERILEDSGLRKDSDYILQAKDLNLSNEDGKKLRPDVIVKLPDGKHLIVDSKVSLLHYEQWANAEDELTKTMASKQFVQSVKNHVLELSAKDYDTLPGMQTPDFVMLFMPIEGAYAFLLQAEPDIHRFAWEKRIVIVCASTLFATLRTVASLWRLEAQNKNADEIARFGGALYDKFHAFIEDLEQLGKQLKRTQETFDGAVNKLHQGRGNLISRVEHLKKLGVKATKQLEVPAE